MSTERHQNGPHLPNNPMTILGLLLVLTSSVTSLFAARSLDPSLRIRWSVGTYYGPEFAPTEPVMLAFPVVVTAAVVAGWWIDRRGVRNWHRDGRFVIALLGYGVGALLVVTQLLLLVLNL